MISGRVYGIFRLPLIMSVNPPLRVHDILSADAFFDDIGAGLWVFILPFNIH